jgi:hypothetical protein
MPQSSLLLYRSAPPELELFYAIARKLKIEKRKLIWGERYFPAAHELNGHLKPSNYILELDQLRKTLATILRGHTILPSQGGGVVVRVVARMEGLVRYAVGECFRALSNLHCVGVI